MTATLDPALLGAAGAVSLLMLLGAPALRVGGVALALGVLSGPGLELPAVWVPLVVAPVLAGGWRRFGAIPALVGLVVALTWGMDPSLWPLAALLAGLSVAAAEPGDASPLWMILPLVGFGAVRVSQVERQLEGLRADRAPAVAEAWGAAWLAPELVEGLMETAWLDEEASVRDRARLLAELGAPRAAFRGLGLEPMPTWERAALLHQAGRPFPARLLAAVDPPEDGVPGPGVVLERRAWADGGEVVVPVLLDEPVDELVLEARGFFLLDFPRVEVTVAGERLGPVEVPEEGERWSLPVALEPGVHRLVVRFENPRRRGKAARAVQELSVSLR